MNGQPTEAGRQAKKPRPQHDTGRRAAPTAKQRPDEQGRRTQEKRRSRTLKTKRKGARQSPSPPTTNYKLTYEKESEQQTNGVPPATRSKRSTSKQTRNKRENDFDRVDNANPIIFAHSPLLFKCHHHSGNAVYQQATLQRLPTNHSRHIPARCRKQASIQEPECQR